MPKVYRWYKRIVDETLYESSKHLLLEDRYPLYAITTDKKMRAQFNRERNPEHFIEIKSKMTKEEFQDYGNKNRGNILDYIEYQTFDHREGRKVIMRPVKVLSTRNEYDLMECYGEGLTDTDQPQGMQFFDAPWILKTEFLNALNVLKYFKFWALNRPDEVKKVPDSMKKYDIEADYSAPNFHIDEYKLYVELFWESYR